MGGLNVVFTHLHWRQESNKVTLYNFKFQHIILCIHEGQFICPLTNDYIYIVYIHALAIIIVSLPALLDSLATLASAKSHSYIQYAKS